MSEADVHDLIVVGGGINGAGIACDAAGRGLKVLLVEAADLASGTSSASSKLVHGGLRYLEHYEFRLVREALMEREVLLAKAPHLVRPLRFVLPHVRGMRPRLMLRSGLFFYDHLARRKLIAGSGAYGPRDEAVWAPLNPGLERGFTYWDCWVDDARLVVANVRAAAARGASILTRTRLVAAEGSRDRWHVRLKDEMSGAERAAAGRVLVNAAGPWVDRVTALVRQGGSPPAGAPRLRLVKGSHIVVPRIAGTADAYLCQNRDGRIVFALPFEEAFTIIGTTDVPFDGDPAEVAISQAEIGYLLDLANDFFRRPLAPADIVWSYAGVRPLYDDASADPSAVTRDYRLELSAAAGAPALLTVLGGKVTTYRRLAEAALAQLAPRLPRPGPAWTAGAPLPGGDLGSDFESFRADLRRRFPRQAPAAVDRLARRYGSDAATILADTSGDGGELGAQLSRVEVDWLRREEWARTPEDVLWRRTKAGLHMNAAERQRIEALLARLL